MTINEEEAKAIALNFITGHKDVSNPRIETIEKKDLQKPKCFIWHVSGAFDWTLERRGSFSLSIHESGDILGATMAAHNIREYESLPVPW